MTSFAMFRLPCEERWRTCRIDWYESQHWRWQWLVEMWLHKCDQQDESNRISEQENQKEIWTIATKTFSCIERQQKTEQRKWEIEQVSWKIVHKNRKAWIRKSHSERNVQVAVRKTNSKMKENEKDCVSLNRIQIRRIILHHKQENQWNTRNWWNIWMNIWLKLNDDSQSTIETKNSNASMT